MRILSGRLRGWRWITGSATHGCWLGTYERETQRVLKRLIEPGAVVYDLGANVGFFTLLASKLAGAAGVVYAFEPLPRNIELLERHVQLNRASNVRVMPLAVTATSGVARFARAANPSMGGLAEEGDVEVRTDSIDALVGSGVIRPPTFLKIDVEGAEDGVLAGAKQVLREHRPDILLSAHGYRKHETCSSLLQDLGYALRDLRDGHADGNYVVLATPK